MYFYRTISIIRNPFVHPFDVSVYTFAHPRTLCSLTIMYIVDYSGSYCGHGDKNYWTFLHILGCQSRSDNNNTILKSKNKGQMILTKEFYRQITCNGILRGRHFAWPAFMEPHDLRGLFLHRVISKLDARSTTLNHKNRDSR